jgi:hypothetical protein
VLDRDEYITNADLFDYPEAVRTAAEEALATLIEMAEARNLPQPRK